MAVVRMWTQDRTVLVTEKWSPWQGSGQNLKEMITYKVRQKRSKTPITRKTWSHKAAVMTDQTHSQNWENSHNCKLSAAFRLHSRAAGLSLHDGTRVAACASSLSLRYMTLNVPDHPEPEPARVEFIQDRFWACLTSQGPRTQNSMPAL